MNNEKISVGLDIGTTKIVAVIGRKNPHGKIEILGMGRAKSLGVSRGVVTNITQTIESIKQAVSEAEARSGLKISEIVAGVAGQHIRSQQHRDYIVRNNPDEVIGESDIDNLISNVQKMNMLPGDEIIHIIPQEFKIDGNIETTEPRGMYGSRLEANFHIVIGDMASIKNIGRCIVSAGLTLQQITLEPLASAEAVLTEEEKEAGVVLVDIGGGTTDVAIFKNGIIRHTAVIPFGGNIITEDIKEGCSIIEKQAELLKIRFGSAWPGENSENEIISIPGLRGRDPKEISRRTLSKIIHARVSEIIEQVFVEIKNYGFNEQRKRLIAGIVLTGGGSQLAHLKQLTSYITGLDTRIGYPNEHLAQNNYPELASPAYATAIGLVMKGLEYQEVEEKKRQREAQHPTVTSTEEMTGKKEESETQEVSDAPHPPKAEDRQTKRASVFDGWVKKLMDFLNNDVKA
ncbi:cell division protein FtsA [Schleiferia thermophila]|jgi:cell division protein FtsA|uniref:cell division protein FtsA n=1 Tax=Schleiferia thermophila TaxID=884107 RepID=UPI0004E77D35|nr:cell division protein FtsA [Schleiferia thermophila]KFD38784.1 cell division protein FtsA [Schleiferia thermophila str. Yellowstone]PMB23092.1 cell division protein FtsA [Fischerella thermalis CCMEE 5319]